MLKTMMGWNGSSVVMRTTTTGPIDCENGRGDDRQSLDLLCRHFLLLAHRQSSAFIIPTESADSFGSILKEESETILFSPFQLRSTTRDGQQRQQGDDGLGGGDHLDDDVASSINFKRLIIS